MQKIISSSVIQPYFIFFHHNPKIWPINTKSCVVMSVAYLLRSCINNYYHGMSVITKNLKIRVVMRKTEGLVKWPISLLRYIKIVLCHIVSIYSKQHLTLLWQQCMHIHNQNMHLPHWKCVFRCCENFHVLIFQVQNQISTIPMSVQQYVFMCIT